MVTKDTMTHIINAGMEIVQGANTTIKNMRVPQETKDRVHKAERELLLAIRSAIDVVVAEIDKETTHTGTELRKIEIKKAKRKSR
ncbi:MAG: hypothetical protein A3K76_02725 [Euryarchaeota archaeon RBG_13_57_23]|nr:MAG: hypothetical protein A3K76_02725 [Euryarchaeota archaeon RBG_13_57_23]